MCLDIVLDNGNAITTPIFWCIGFCDDGEIIIYRADQFPPRTCRPYRDEDGTVLFDCYEDAWFESEIIANERE